MKHSTIAFEFTEPFTEQTDRGSILTHRAGDRVSNAADAIALMAKGAPLERLPDDDWVLANSIWSIAHLWKFENLADYLEFAARGIRNSHEEPRQRSIFGWTSKAVTDDETLIEFLDTMEPQLLAKISDDIGAIRADVAARAALKASL